jgi:hypothetical protein
VREHARAGPVDAALLRIGSFGLIDGTPARTIRFERVSTTWAP